jgi:hypothetical protein
MDMTLSMTAEKQKIQHMSPSKRENKVSPLSAGGGDPAAALCLATGTAELSTGPSETRDQALAVALIPETGTPNPSSPHLLASPFLLFDGQITDSHQESSLLVSPSVDSSTELAGDSDCLFTTEEEENAGRERNPTGVPMAGTLQPPLLHAPGITEPHHWSQLDRSWSPAETPPPHFTSSPRPSNYYS